MNQNIHKIGFIVPSVFLLSSLLWNALYGQPVPVFPPEAGTVPIYRIIDSLELHQIEIDIRKAEDQVSQTSFFRRLLPEIHISASYGIGNLLFIDPSSSAAYIIPKDAYRLSLSLSVSDLFFSSKHSDAILQLERIQEEYQLKKLLHLCSFQTYRLELESIEEKLRSLESKTSIIQDLIHFNELRFEQGKIEYDALIRTKLELLSLQSDINTLKHQRAQLLLKLQKDSNNE
ncbi:MAG: TolC family protein [Bacteroidota bacterium]